MSEQIQTFWNDPKIWISMIAAAIAMLSFIFTLYNQSNQNKKWDQLNTANIDIVDSKITTWNEYDRVEAQKINWGYQPLLISSENNYEKFSLRSVIVALDTDRNERVENFNYVYTLDEAQKQLHSLGLEKKPNIQFRILLKYKVEIKNLGKTEAINAHFKVRVRISDGDWLETLINPKTFNIMPERNIGLSDELMFSPVIPDKIELKIDCEYDDINRKKIIKTWDLIYTKNNNNWSY